MNKAFHFLWQSFARLFLALALGFVLVWMIVRPWDGSSTPAELSPKVWERPYAAIRSSALRTARALVALKGARDAQFPVATPDLGLVEQPAVRLPNRSQGGNEEVVNAPYRDLYGLPLLPPLATESWNARFPHLETGRLALVHEPGGGYESFEPFPPSLVLPGRGPVTSIGLAFRVDQLGREEAEHGRIAEIGRRAAERQRRMDLFKMLLLPAVLIFLIVLVRWTDPTAGQGFGMVVVALALMGMFIPNFRHGGEPRTHDEASLDPATRQEMEAAWRGVLDDLVTEGRLPASEAAALRKAAESEVPPTP